MKSFNTESRNSSKVISCKDAKAEGLSRYFTGKPCKRGHVAERYTRTGNCIQCDNERCNNSYHTSEAHREYVRDYGKRWAQANPEKVKAHMRQWDKRNHKKRLADNMKRHAAKLRRTPGWADMRAIEEFYKNCPEGYHVDHTVPLQGEIVSGLHVLNNLQYLPAKENLSKGNRYAD